MPYFIYTDLICSLLDPVLTMTCVDAYGPKSVDF